MPYLGPPNQHAQPGDQVLVESGPGISVRNPTNGQPTMMMAMPTKYLARSSHSSHSRHSTQSRVRCAPGGALPLLLPEEELEGLRAHALPCKHCEPDAPSSESALVGPSSRASPKRKATFLAFFSRNDSLARSPVCLAGVPESKKRAVEEQKDTQRDAKHANTAKTSCDAGIVTPQKICLFHVISCYSCYFMFPWHSGLLHADRCPKPSTDGRAVATDLASSLSRCSHPRLNTP